MTYSPLQRARSRALRLVSLASLVAVGLLASVLTPTAAAGEPPEEPITEECVGSGAYGRVCGTLNPHASAKAGYYFALNTGSSCTGGRKTQKMPEVEGKNIRVSSELTGLLSNAQYTYCLVATNQFGETFGKGVSFTTPPGPPEEPITEECAVSAGATYGRVCGTLNPHANGKVGYYFVINTGSSCTGGHKTMGEPEVEGEDIRVSSEVTGLLPNTRYTYCLVATSEFGNILGKGMSLTTGLERPAIDAESVSSITQINATLLAEINPNNTPTSPSFRYSTSESLAGAKIATGEPLAAGFGDQLVSVTIEGLAPSTTYYYQAIATNSAMEASEGTLRSFTTLASQTTTTGTIQPGGGQTNTTPTLSTTATSQITPTAERPSKRTTLTDAQRLTKALKACKRKPRKLRANCQKQAHKRYSVRAKRGERS